MADGYTIVELQERARIAIPIWEATRREMIRNRLQVSANCARWMARGNEIVQLIHVWPWPIYYIAGDD